MSAAQAPNLRSSQAVDVIRQSILELLQLAVFSCHARFAVARILDEPPIATHTSVPLEQEAAVAERALHSDKTVSATHDFAATRLRGADGKVWGTISVGGAAPPTIRRNCS